RTPLRPDFDISQHTEESVSSYGLSASISVNYHVALFMQCCIVILFLAPSYSYSSNLGAMRISLIEGDVQISTVDTSEWVAAAVNMPLREGDKIWVLEEGRTELQVKDGSFVRLNGRTSLEIVETEREPLRFYLTAGIAYVNFKGGRGKLFVDTPFALIRATEKTTFSLVVSEDGYAKISVFTGKVYADNGVKSTEVVNGYALLIKGEDYADLYPLRSHDEWERWNRERDYSLSDRRYSSRYLPEDLSIYSYDFDRYGKWVYVREYGYVWTPTIVVSIGWTPYRHGRWLWMDDDYVWISYDPWGWAPYHYGRWARISSLGWCWVPPSRGAVYWGPGFVGWVYTPEYVAWVPLAPGEIYYGYGYYGYYGPSSVNIININKTKVKNVYKNVFVHDAVTVIHRDTFTAGKPVVNIRMRENPFLRGKISIGRPEIKPERGITMPVHRERPGIKQPSQRIRDMRVKDLRENQRFAGERTNSIVKFWSSREMVRSEHRIKEAPQGRKIERSFERKEPIGRSGFGEPLIGKEKNTDRPMRTNLDKKIGKTGKGRMPVLREIEKTREQKLLVKREETERPLKVKKENGRGTSGHGPIKKW
ncbi:MAG: FecR family protein, partial [Nitrospirota bacterium]